MLTHLGECCHPVPGDAIIATSRAPGSHGPQKNCPNVIHEREKERLIEVEWGQIEAVYPSKIQVEAWTE